MTSINGLMALAGGFTLFFSKRDLNKILLTLVSLSIGALIGGAFFHFIPESLEKISLTKTVLFILIGIIIFYLTEKILHWHHCHEGECKIHPFSYLILYGDGLHNFIDGLIIASSFIISIPFGIVTSLIIMAHELPQEIADFGVLVHGGFSRAKALFYNFLSQLTAILGGVLGFFFLSIKDYSVYLLPIAAGGFLYIAVKDLIPEVLKEKNPKKKIINLMAIIFGLLILISSKYLIG